MRNLADNASTLLGLVLVFSACSDSSVSVAPEPYVPPPKVMVVSESADPTEPGDLGTVSVAGRTLQAKGSITLPLHADQPLRLHFATENATELRHTAGPALPKDQGNYRLDVDPVMMKKMGVDSLLKSDQAVEWHLPLEVSGPGGTANADYDVKLQLNHVGRFLAAVYAPLTRGEPMPALPSDGPLILIGDVAWSPVETARLGEIARVGFVTATRREIKKCAYQELSMTGSRREIPFDRVELDVTIRHAATGAVLGRKQFAGGTRCPEMVSKKDRVEDIPYQAIGAWANTLTLRESKAS